MGATFTRRALLFGRATAPAAPAARPPWALEAEAFAAACTRCDACIDACGERVLSRGADGLPRFEAGTGECTFCGDCAAACGTGALAAAVSPPWHLRARVAEACLPGKGVVCASCRDVCPENAIRVPPGGRGAAVVDAARCTGCGACVGVCPASALALVDSPLEAAA